MKKGIIVLLITVLAAGMAFATFEGSAKISLGYDFDEKDGKQPWGFANASAVSKYEFKFTFDTQSVAVGADHQTNVWAEIAASGEAYVDQKTAVVVDAKISTANIHINDITIGILGAGGAYSYASDYHKDTTGKTINNIVVSNVNLLDPSFKDGKFDKYSTFAANGFTFEYAGFKGGFGANGDKANESYNVLAHIQTKEIDVDGFKAQAALFGYLGDKNKAGAASVKAGYAADKLSASVAGDLQVIKDGEADAVFSAEAAANARYDFIVLDVYMLAGAKATQAKNIKLNTGVMYDDNHIVKLDGRLGAEYEIKEGITVSGSVDATDVLIEKREINIEAGAEATIAPMKYEAGVSYAIYAKELAPSAKVTYTHEIFTAYAGIDAKIGFGDEVSLNALKPEVGISSKSVVENAELALTWKGSDFAKGVDKKGAITASATIKF